MATIEKRVSSDGTVSWRARVRIRGQQRTETFQKKTDAKLWASDIETKLKLGKRVPTLEATRRTVSDLIDYYLEEHLPTKKRNRDERNYRRHLEWWRDAIGNVPLIDVTGRILTKHRDRLLREGGAGDEPIGPATVNRYLASLSHAFTVAERTLEWTDSNPVHRVERLEEPEGRERFLDPDEILALLKAAKANRSKSMYPIVVLALSTGMRQGEILGLRWHEIDFDAGNITLTKERTKTSKRRVVPLVGHAMEVLREWSRVREIDTDLVFPGRRRPNGDRKPLNIRVTWGNILREAGIEDYRFHDNRHSAASYLLMTGASDMEVAGILGHETLAMVKRYSHMSDQHRRKVLERMNQELFGGEAS